MPDSKGSSYMQREHHPARVLENEALISPQSRLSPLSISILEYELPNR
jgi:hypothetical protein